MIPSYQPLGRKWRLNHNKIQQFYVNVSGMCPRSRLNSQPLTIPAPWVLLHIGWSITMVPPGVTASRFLAGNREAELKSNTFSSLLLFRVFLLSSSPNSQRYNTFECCLLRLLLNNNNILHHPNSNPSTLVSHHAQCIPINYSIQNPTQVTPELLLSLPPQYGYMLQQHTP